MPTLPRIAVKEPRWLPLYRLVVACLLLAPMVAPAADRATAAGGGVELVAAAGGPVGVEKVRLAGATRDAFAADPSGVVTGWCSGDAGVLIASVGTRGLTAADSVTFRIEVERDGQWLELLDEVVTGDSGRWLDHRIELAASGPARRRLRFGAVATGAPGGQAFWGSVRFLAAAADAPPNVVLISLDTLGAEYVGWYGGHPEATRSLDGFLDRAFTFRRAYATYPNTLVSHASLFSGLYPSSHGVYGSVRDSDVSVDLISTVLRREGYLNVAFTENAFVSSDFGFDRDFDWYDDGPDRGASSFLGDARETYGRAGAWLERYGSDAPFLLFVHTYEVHSPYVVRDAPSKAVADAVFAGAEVTSDATSAADREHLHNAGFDRFAPDEVRRLEALHVGEISYLDRQLAELMGTLERMPFADRTLVVIFADHGDEFDPTGKIGHGETLHDVVLHVPLAFYLPGRIERGEFAAPVSLVDVAPTVLDFLGKAGALAVDGRSLLPLLDKRAQDLPPRPVFAELERAAGSCLELRLPQECLVGRFVVYSEDRRFESSMVPNYETLRRGKSDEPVPEAAEIDEFRALLSAYVTGSPWDTKAPWRPQSVEVDRAKRPAIDDVTRKRLEALGYDF